jgi:hypothetical protein
MAEHHHPSLLGVGGIDKHFALVIHSSKSLARTRDIHRAPWTRPDAAVPLVPTPIAVATWGPGRPRVRQQVAVGRSISGRPALAVAQGGSAACGCPRVPLRYEDVTVMIHVDLRGAVSDSNAPHPESNARMQGKLSGLDRWSAHRLPAPVLSRRERDPVTGESILAMFEAGLSRRLRSKRGRQTVRPRSWQLQPSRSVGVSVTAVYRQAASLVSAGPERHALNGRRRQRMRRFATVYLCPHPLGSKRVLGMTARALRTLS